jgi:hypothetical protein
MFSSAFYIVICQRMKRVVVHTSCGTPVNFEGVCAAIPLTLQHSGHYANEEHVDRCSTRILVYSRFMCTLYFPRLFSKGQGPRVQIYSHKRCLHRLTICFPRLSDDHAQQLGAAELQHGVPQPCTLVLHISIFHCSLADRDGAILVND